MSVYEDLLAQAKTARDHRSEEAQQMFGLLEVLVQHVASLQTTISGMEERLGAQDRKISLLEFRADLAEDAEDALVSGGAGGRGCGGAGGGAGCGAAASAARATADAAGVAVVLAEPVHAAAIAELWRSTYFDQGGAEALPEEFLAERRSLPLFLSRATAFVRGQSAYVVLAPSSSGGGGGGVAEVVGFANVKEWGEEAGELNQFFVARSARGSGAAAALLAAAEAALRRSDEFGASARRGRAAKSVEGPAVYLHCLTENHRALRFYQKSGFVVAGEVVHRSPISGGGTFPLRLQQLEKP